MTQIAPCPSHPSIVRLHRTGGLSSASAELRTLDGERVADAPSWAGDVPGTQQLAVEWAIRTAARLGLRLVRGEPRINRSSEPRWTVEGWDGHTVWLS